MPGTYEVEDRFLDSEGQATQMGTGHNEFWVVSPDEETWIVRGPSLMTFNVRGSVSVDAGPLLTGWIRFEGTGLAVYTRPM